MWIGQNGKRRSLLSDLVTYGDVHINSDDVAKAVLSIITKSMMRTLFQYVAEWYIQCVIVLSQFVGIMFDTDLK